MFAHDGNVVLGKDSKLALSHTDDDPQGTLATVTGLYKAKHEYAYAPHKKHPWKFTANPTLTRFPASPIVLMSEVFEPVSKDKGKFADVNAIVEYVATHPTEAVPVNPFP